jgi:hypothetical protein
VNTGFAAPGDHHVCVAKLYETTGIANGVRTSRAGGRYSVIRALEVVLHGNVPGGKIYE